REFGNAEWALVSAGVCSSIGSLLYRSAWLLLEKWSNRAPCRDCLYGRRSELGSRSCAAQLLERQRRRLGTPNGADRAIRSRCHANFYRYEAGGPEIERYEDRVFNPGRSYLYLAFF